MKHVFVALALFLVPYGASAATLYLSPSSGSYPAGKPFTVNVFASSQGEAMNAVSATILVDPNKFSVTSASSIGSIVNFWVQQPQVSGSNISFEGVVLNPGYQGAGAKVASFVLVPKGSGNGSVSFSSASVLANDGQGTNILETTSGATYTITEAIVIPPPVVTPPKEESKEDPIEVAPPAPSQGVAESPQVTHYTEHLSYGDLVAVRGVTYENATVEFLMYEKSALITTDYAVSNSSGDYSVVLAKRYVPGTYQLFVRVTTGEGLKSEATGPFGIKVDGGVFASLDWLTVGHLALLVLGILAIIGALSVFHAVGFNRLFKLTHELRQSHNESTDMAKRVFEILKKDLASHVKKIRLAGETRLLTNEELAFLREFEEELEEAETALRSKKKKKTSS